ncbi:MAG TPA: hypothetical protein GXX55_02025 [Firmicutes bacterium]|nr:hypothetical protein [Bacillota bacterium]
MPFFTMLVKRKWPPGQPHSSVALFSPAELYASGAGLSTGLYRPLRFRLRLNYISRSFLVRIEEY